MAATPTRMERSALRSVCMQVIGGAVFISIVQAAWLLRPLPQSEDAILLATLAGEQIDDPSRLYRAAYGLVIAVGGLLLIFAMRRGTSRTALIGGLIGVAISLPAVVLTAVYNDFNGAMAAACPVFAAALVFVVGLAWRRLPDPDRCTLQFVADGPEVGEHGVEQGALEELHAE